MRTDRMHGTARTRRSAIRPRRAVAVAAAAALLAGCTGVNASDTTTAASETTSVAAEAEGGSETATGGSEHPVWAEVGDLGPAQYSAPPITDEQVEAAIAGLDELGETVLSESGLPGIAIGVVHHDELVYAKGFGVREVGKPELIDENTVFQIASVSKSIGSTVVAHAVSEGIVSWDDTVVTYLPEFQLSDPRVTQMVTIADLYSHRSGIPGAAGDDLEGLGFSRQEIIDRLRLFPLTPFRISYNYTNFGMTTGGEAVATAAGRSWEDLSEELLYAPLGMTSTSSRYDDFLARDNRATIHFNEGNGVFEPLYTRDPDEQSPAGGVSSNIVDMAQWLRLNLASGTFDDEPLIDPAVLQEGHTPQAVNHRATQPDERSEFYGYGANVAGSSTGHVKWYHSGAFYVGAGTAYLMIPAADVGIIVLTNGSPVGAAEAITFTFSDLVRTGVVSRDWYPYWAGLYAQLFVNPSEVGTTPPPENPAPARPVADYVGTYTNDYAGDVTVTASGDTLTVAVGPRGDSAELTHYNGDTFTWLPPGENHDPTTGVFFDGPAGGPATSVQLEFLTAGLNTFTRS